MAKNQSADALLARAQKPAQPGVTPIHRAVYTYDIPGKLARETGFAALGFYKLTVEEEMAATRRARGDAMRLAMELSKQSLCAYTPFQEPAEEADEGEPEQEQRPVAALHVGQADGSVDTLWARLDPKLRTMAMAAYGDLHQPEEAAVDVFLKSRRVRA